MEMKTSVEAGIVTLLPTGDLANATAPLFRAECDQLLELGHSQFVLDMSGVRLLSSIGIREILYLHNACSQGGGALKLIHLSGQVADILRVTGLHKIVNVEN